MKFWQTLVSLSRTLPVSNPSRKIVVARANVMQPRRSFNGVGVKHLTTVAMGGDTAAQTAKTSVWWDFENCQVPKGFDVLKIAKNIEFALREHNYHGSFAIRAYGDTNQMPSSPVQQALCSTGISLHHVPSGKKDGTDKKIIVEMLLWAMENKAPANIVLISGDGDFSYVLSKLRMKNYNILLIRPQKSYSPILVSVAKTVLLWKSIVGYEELTKHVQPSKKSKMVCEICNVTCTSSVVFNSHISGKKHKKKVALVAKPNQKD